MLWILHFFSNFINYSYNKLNTLSDSFFKLSNLIIRLKKTSHMLDDVILSKPITFNKNITPRFKKLKKISFLKLIKIKNIFLNMVDKIKLNNNFKLTVNKL